MSDEIDITAAIARIEQFGFTEPDDGKVILKFLKTLNTERAAAAERISALENNQVTTEHVARFIGLIEGLLQRMTLAEQQLAAQQRQSSTAN